MVEQPDGTLAHPVGGPIAVSGHEAGRVIEAANCLGLQRDEFGLGVGVSTGAASAILTSESTLTPADLFAAADRAQYQAKRDTLGHTAIADGFL